MKVAFRVISEFKASAVGSGQDRAFEPGDEVFSALGQFEEVIVIEADQIVYRVKRSTFEGCCICNNLGVGGPGP